MSYAHRAMKPLVSAKNLEEHREARKAAFKERQANIEAQKRVAEEAADRRVLRRTGTLFERVDAARKRLEPMPAGAVLILFEQASDAEREVLYLAEEAGKNRPQVLRMAVTPRKATRELYEQEALDRFDAEEPVSPADERPAPKKRGGTPRVKE
jgi:hypothetical protein